MTAAIAAIVSVAAALEQFLMLFLLGFFREIAPRMFDEVVFIFLQTSSEAGKWCWTWSFDVS